MSKGRSGYFSGTSGANADETTNATAEGVKDTKVAETYSETDTLRNHIENVQGVSGTGVAGAHNKESFMGAVRENNILIENTVPNSQIDGVEKITYKIPARDKAGRPTGEYKSKTFSKTVYDPAKISTDDYIARGLEAANNATKIEKLGHYWTGTDNQGVQWMGYCDDNGNITSFFPND